MTPTPTMDGGTVADDDTTKALAELTAMRKIVLALAPFDGQSRAAILGAAVLIEHDRMRLAALDGEG